MRSPVLNDRSPSACASKSYKAVTYSGSGLGFGFSGGGGGGARFAAAAALVPLLEAEDAEGVYGGGAAGWLAGGGGGFLV